MKEKKKAKPVSRGVFQKKAEECKRLKRDIYLMTMKHDVTVFNKWIKYFKQEEQFTDLLKEAAINYFKSPTLKP